MIDRDLLLLDVCKKKNVKSSKRAEHKDVQMANDLPAARKVNPTLVDALNKNKRSSFRKSEHLFLDKQFSASTARTVRDISRLQI